MLVVQIPALRPAPAVRAPQVDRTGLTTDAVIVSNEIAADEVPHDRSPRPYEIECLTLRQLQCHNPAHQECVQLRADQRIIREACALFGPISSGGWRRTCTMGYKTVTRLVHGARSVRVAAAGATTGRRRRHIPAGGVRRYREDGELLVQRAAAARWTLRGARTGHERFKRVAAIAAQVLENGHASSLPRPRLESLEPWRRTISTRSGQRFAV